MASVNEASSHGPNVTAAVDEKVACIARRWHANGTSASTRAFACASIISVVSGSSFNQIRGDHLEVFRGERARARHVATHARSRIHRACALTISATSRQFAT